MNGRKKVLLSTAILSVAFVIGLLACGKDSGGGDRVQQQISEGRNIFRFDTFGNESLWTDALRLHEPVNGVAPQNALALGIKVDAEALSPEITEGIRSGTVNLASAETTLELLKANAIIGVKGSIENVDGVNKLTRVGITCALCHSTVDSSLAPGIGKRLDGWPNRELNVGAIIALSPGLSEEQKAVYNSWGPGKYDPRYNQDEKNGPVVIPPAYGLEGILKITFTGDGDDISYWNRYVGVTQMGGHGHFSDDRTAVSVTNGTDDQISSKLPALRAYQLSLKAPAAPEGSFNTESAARGKGLFEGKAACVTCHGGSTFTDANQRLHEPGEVVSEPEAEGVPSYAARSATKKYRASPLKGIWQHAPYFHNGSAATLNDVVARYNERKFLNLTAEEQTDLVEYLKSL